MKLSTILRLISANYYFHVYNASFVNGNYLIETNYGPKRVSLWKDKYIVDWAFLWREGLAKKGYRQIDRFIRTQSGAAYVQVKDEYLVIQDDFQGETLDFEQPQLMHFLGHFVGELLQACLEATRLAKNEREHYYWRRSIKQEDREELYVLKKKITVSTQTMFSYLVSKHWRSIERRWKQGIALQQASEFSRLEIITPSSLQLRNWLLIEQGYLVFHWPEQNISGDYRCLARIMQELYLQKNRSFEEIQRFYEGFCQVYQPDRRVHYNVLAHLIAPTSFLMILKNYLAKEYSAEECAELWLEQCYLQNKLDHLHVWFASYLDQGREETELG